MFRRDDPLADHASIEQFFGAKVIPGMPLAGQECRCSGCIRLRNDMDKHQHHVLARRFGAVAIEERLTEVALLMRIAFPQCEWHLDSDPDSRELQQLNVGFSGARITLYFTNEELCAYSGEKRRCDTDHRLHRALGKLLDEHAVPDKHAH